MSEKLRLRRERASEKLLKFLRYDHEFTGSQDRRVRVGTAVHDVHQGNRKHLDAFGPPKVLEQRLARGNRGSFWLWREKRREWHFAPSFDLVDVPSSLIIARSTPTNGSESIIANKGRGDFRFNIGDSL